MPTQSFLTTCIKNIPLSRSGSTFEVKLKMTEGERFQFKAGQFVLFDVPSVENPADIQSRAYSIASPPSEDQELTFVIMNKEGGRATRWVKEVLKVGDIVRIQGPFGVFTLDKETDKEYFFIGTGTGIAPFVSQVRYALETLEDPRTMHFVFGARHEADLFWVEKLHSLEESYSNFHLHTALTRPDDDWRGKKGRVTDVLHDIVSHFSRIQAYICGNPDMVRDTKAWLIAKGMDKRDVRGEGYV